MNKNRFSLLDLYSRPISFLPILGRLAGSDAVCALWLSAAMEWQKAAGEGVFWLRTAAEWSNACLLTRRDQERARRVWGRLGILHEKRAGALKGPGNALEFCLDLIALDALIRGGLDAKNPPFFVPSKSTKRTVQKSTKRTVLNCTVSPVVVDSTNLIYKEKRAESEERNEQKQQAAEPPRARTLTNFVEPTKAEWIEHCKSIDPTWQALDIERAYNSARAGGWTRGKGGRIRDWKAHAETCNCVWKSSRAGIEAARAARRAEPSPDMTKRLEAAAMAEEKRKQTAATTPKADRGEVQAKHAELLKLMGVKKI